MSFFSDCHIVTSAVARLEPNWRLTLCFMQGAKDSLDVHVKKVDMALNAALQKHFNATVIISYADLKSNLIYSELDYLLPVVQNRWLI